MLALSTPTSAFAQAPAAAQSDEQAAPAGSGAAEGVEAAAAEAADPGAPVAGEEATAARIDALFGKGVSALAAVLFWEIPVGDVGVPFVVAWLFIGAIFLTLRLKFVSIRGFRHAIDVLRGVYDDPNDAGEVTHFQALASALSATVGLGNIAGVALAVKIGGAGAVFWMLVAAFFGMTAKFAECTLGQKYRLVDAQGRVLGGPMRYLKAGLAEKRLGALGSVLAFVFAVFCIGGSFGGGNMFQANQACSAISAGLSDNFGVELDPRLFGLALVVAVGAVILGGFTRIAKTAERIVPLMCGMYVLAAGFIVITNLQSLPAALGHIFHDAFNPASVEGGALGALLVGVRRAAFSNEAGIGSAAIAHSAAKTHEPVREGMVALLEPFIDTIIVCLATALVIVVSGVAADPANADLDGAVLTMRAFEQTISWFPLVLTTAIVLFAYSTMISWSYYGERCWTLLFGARSSTVYRVVFLVFVYIGSVSKLSNVLDFSDLMILSMAVPNILGLYILSNDLARDTESYVSRLRDGGFKRFK
ncbi:MAG: alanine:cation symporter family protein [Myxococcales bacterium]|nr:alanine:cation symporter family protein [Myxococcales bacterium]MCB9531097.1 alanine:cation symporter family protein [Myxococcales bacterium]